MVQPMKKSRTRYARAPYRRSQKAVKRYQPRSRAGLALGEETKFLDTSYAATAMSQTLAGAEADPGTVLSLNATAQGDGESNRDGRRQIIKSVKVHGIVALPSVEAINGPQNGQVAFVACVLDKQTNGAQLNAEDVFTGAIPERPFRNMQYIDRFEVLWAKTFNLSHDGVTQDGANNFSAPGKQIVFNINKKCNFPVTYTNTTGVVGSVSDNSVHMIAVAPGGTPTLEYNARCTFVG